MKEGGGREGGRKGVDIVDIADIVVELGGGGYVSVYAM